MSEMFIENEAAMAALGERLANFCPPQCVIYLVGELGAGKTTLVRAFLQAAGHHGSVKSPTYTLVEPYEIAGRQYYHLDLYRLSDPEELEFLGLRDMLEGQSVMLVEWPQKGQGVLPVADLVLTIDYAGTGRQINLEAGSESGQKMLDSLA